MARDMTDRQFMEAIKRNGFKLRAMWLIDVTKGPSEPGSFGYGLVFQQKPFKLNRRASLAHALARRAEDRAKAA